MNGIDGILEVVAHGLDSAAEQRELDEVTAQLERQILYLIAGIGGLAKRLRSGRVRAGS
ncbi:hypothetical protein ABZ540_31425 [Nocardia xishanensis]|uniref:hypothetical protein n=1 Tax=Nocardia xishanensis TaxID=238964 RepID=UPI0033C23E27